MNASYTRSDGTHIEVRRAEIHNGKQTYEYLLFAGRRMEKGKVYAEREWQAILRVEEIYDNRAAGIVSTVNYEVGNA